MTQVTVLNDKAIAIQVPEDSNGFGTDHTGDFFYEYDVVNGGNMRTGWIAINTLPEGNWSILGKPEEMNVEQCAMVMGDDERSLYLLLVENKLYDKSIIILIK